MRLELQIAGMTCAACAEHVEHALTHAGARDVRVDWQLGRANVDADGVPNAELVRALDGLGATLFMEYTSSWLYGKQDEAARKREEQLRAAMPTTVLVRKAAGLIGSELDDQTAEKLGMIAHYAFGAGGGPAAVALRRVGVSPIAAGLTVAGAMEVVVDQGMNHLLGLTAPPAEWPWQAHARGGAAHIAYGTAVGLMLAAGADD